MVDGREDSLVRGLLTGIAAFRWLAWTWMAIVMLLSRDDLERTWLAIVLVTAALIVTGAATLVTRLEPERLCTLPALVIELSVGFALSAGDGWAYAGDHPQSLGSVWPLAGVLTAGVALAARGGAAAGAVVGLGRLCGDALLPGSTRPIAELTVSASSTFVLYALTGGVAGYVTVKLREAERRISIVRAREEVARTLHDGVLQTLAVVQRRATDPDLARLAREQERELRDYLFAVEPAGGDLGPRLREAAARFEDRFGARASVIVADDLPRPQTPVVDALVGAVSEALANAGKHGAATHVTVYVEPADDGSVFCSVKDDGRGFEGAVEGVGLTRSIRGRLADVGGRAEIDGNPGHGTEVRLWA
jgi:signal transduction histidine kinase